MTELERARNALEILKQWNLLRDARDAYLLAIANWGLREENEKPICAGKSAMAKADYLDGAIIFVESVLADLRRAENERNNATKN